jgi:hypothetical protein
MRIVNRIIALTRSIQLNRQFREIEKVIAELPLSTRRQLAAISMREFATAAKSEVPHMYGSVDQGPRYQPWGNGTDIGYARLRSDNEHLQLRGIALWLTVAYYETKDSKFSEAQDLHRHLMRTLRVLKESLPPGDAAELAAQTRRVA